jgi:hypothetical protein
MIRKPVFWIHIEFDGRSFPAPQDLRQGNADGA